MKDYLPTRRNLHRFVFYNSLYTDQTRYGDKGVEVYEEAEEYIGKNVQHFLKGKNRSDSSEYQQALNLLRKMADNELKKEKDFLFSKINDPLMPIELKKSIQNLYNSSTDYTSFLRLINEYYLKTRKVEQKIEQELESLETISEVIEKAYTNKHNFQSDKELKKKRTILKNYNPSNSNFFITGRKKGQAPKKARISKEDGVRIGEALKKAEQNRITLEDLDKKSFQKLIDSIFKALENDRRFPMIINAISGNLAAKNNLIKILDYVVLLFYQEYARDQVNSYNSTGMNKSLKSVLTEFPIEENDQDLANAVEKALSYFSNNLELIENMTDELLGESQSLQDYQKMRKEALVKIADLGEQLGVTGLITKKGITTSQRKKDQIKVLAEQGSQEAKQIISLLEQYEKKREARPSGYSKLFVQGEIAQTIESGIQHNVLKASRKGQISAKDDTLTFHLEYTPSPFLIENGSTKSLEKKLREKVDNTYKQILEISKNGSMDKKDLQKRFKEQRKIYDQLEKDLLKLKKELETTKENLNLFVEHGTTKDYTFLSNKIGFFAGAIGKNDGVVSAIENIELMAEKGGISFADKNWLIFSAINCARHLIGESMVIQSPLENYLSLIAGALMFEDADMIMEEINDKYSEATNQSIKHIHIYRLNGYYFPLSYILNQTWEGLKDLDIFLNDAKHSGNQVHIINNATWKNFKTEPVLTKEIWEKEATHAIDSTTITMTFMAGFLDVLNDMKLISPSSLP